MSGHKCVTYDKLGHRNLLQLLKNAPCHFMIRCKRFREGPRIFRWYYINTMPSMLWARSSAATLLRIWNGYTIEFLEIESQTPAVSMYDMKKMHNHDSSNILPINGKSHSLILHQFPFNIVGVTLTVIFHKDDINFSTRRIHLFHEMPGGTLIEIPVRNSVVELVWWFA